MKLRRMYSFGFSLACLVTTVACQPSPTAEAPSSPPTVSEGSEGKAVPFGYKTIWLAVHTNNPQAVVDALGGASRPATWEEGLAESKGLFVTPPIEDWVLVTGNIPAADTTDLNARIALPTALSSRLETEVQYFGTHRIVEWHAWARVLRGEVVRAYGYVGESSETLFDVGEPTREERELGFAFFDERSPQAQRPGYWERANLRHPDEQDVTGLAGRWSINPTTLGERGAVGHGWIVER